MGHQMMDKKQHGHAHQAKRLRDTGDALGGNTVVAYVIDLLGYVAKGTTISSCQLRPNNIQRQHQ